MCENGEFVNTTNKKKLRMECVCVRARAHLRAASECDAHLWLLFTSRCQFVSIGLSRSVSQYRPNAIPLKWAFATHTHTRGTLPNVKNNVRSIVI